MRIQGKKFIPYEIANKTPIDFATKFLPLNCMQIFSLMCFFVLELFCSDYQASESGHGLNITVHFINFMAAIGAAYDLKTANKSVVNLTKQKIIEKSLKFD